MSRLTGAIERVLLARWLGGITRIRGCRGRIFPTIREAASIKCTIPLPERSTRKTGITRTVEEAMAPRTTGQACVPVGSMAIPQGKEEAGLTRVRRLPLARTRPALPMADSAQAKGGAPMQP